MQIGIEEGLEDEVDFDEYVCDTSGHDESSAIASESSQTGSAYHP